MSNYYMVVDKPRAYLEAGEKALVEMPKGQGRKRAANSDAGLKKLNFAKIKDERSREKVYVHFIHNLRNAKSNKEFEELYDVVTKAHNMMEKDHIIIVVFDDLTEKHRSLEVEFPNLTLFTYKNLMFNIVDHEFVPHHESLTAAEKIKLLSDFMIKDYNKLPLISKFDPVCRYYNFKIGDVLRITRPSDANKTYVSYRYVQLLD